MESGSKRHTGIEDNFDVITFRLEFTPGWTNHHAFTDTMNLKVFLPGIGPILLLQVGDTNIAHATQLPEEIERLTHLFDDRRIEVLFGHIGVDRERLFEIDAEIVAILILHVWLIDGDAVVEPIAAKELCYGFHGFVIDIN